MDSLPRVKLIGTKLLLLFASLLLLAVCLSISALAGDIVSFEASGDYAGEAPFTEETTTFAVPRSIDKTWLPLNEACKLLPVSYRLEKNILCIVNDEAEAAGSVRATRRFRMDGTWNDTVRKVNGKYYVCPRILNLILDEQCVSINDEAVYYYRPQEDFTTEYIVNNWNDDFTDQVNKALYALWKAAPDAYYLTVGELGQIRQDGKDSEYSYASAYVWPGKNTCYIVKPNLSTLKLAAVLAHEATHVAFYKKWSSSRMAGDYSLQSEAAAHDYEVIVSGKLIGA